MPKKSLIIEFFLCLFLGVFGAHRFYTKRWITASTMLLLSLTGWGLMITVIWTLLDLIIVIIYLSPDNKSGENKVNVIPVEETQEQKIEKTKTESYTENSTYYNRGLCPYCKEKTEDKKSKDFNCSVCKNKIHRRKHFKSQKILYLTSEQLLEFDKMQENYTKEKRYISLCKKINSTGVIYVNSKNPQTTLKQLHFGKKSFYTKNNIGDLRICRHYEGLLQRIYGTPEQATNAFMSVIYIDLLGNYDILEHRWSEGAVYPNAYKNAFKEKLSPEKFEKIFKFNAESLQNALNFSLPVTPDEAWQKILEYRKNEEKEQI